MTGTLPTWNVAPALAVPATVTVTAPVVELAGTVTVMLVLLQAGGANWTRAGCQAGDGWGRERRGDVDSGIGGTVQGALDAELAAKRTTTGRHCEVHSGLGASPLT
jgi:hypothetical protein